MELVCDIISRYHSEHALKRLGIVGDDSKGFYIRPTVILTKDPKSVTMVEEIFGPVLTVSSYLPLPQATHERLDIRSSYLKILSMKRL